jgi:thymidine phosphorylase
MTDLRQAAQQALEALEDERYVTKYTHIVEAITALRKALEQPEFYQPAASEAVEILQSLGYVYEPTYAGLAWVAKKSAQPEQEPVRYDKTEINCFVQSLYDQKMQEGKHGHYETMFHVVHQAIKKVAPPAAQRPWQGLTDEDRRKFAAAQYGWEDLLIAAEAKLKERNT